MTEETPPLSFGLGRWGRLVASCLLVALLLSSGYLAASATASPSSIDPGHAASPAATHLPRTTMSSASTARAPAPLATSGRGTFFTSTAIPNGPATQLTCYYGACSNVSNNPSLNLTTGGTLGIAYTAYVNASPCAAAAPYAQSEVGFSSSSNGGTTWSTPIYLGNSDCTSAVVGKYPSAWEPSLTSLGNGTLVLVYVEYNVTAPFYYLPYVEFGPSTWNVLYDRLVVTESYNNGVTWTTPTVLNSSANPSLGAGAYAPQRPWVSATGQTIYVAWMNWTEDVGVGQGSAWVHFVASTDGGATWGTPVSLRSEGSGGIDFSMNPMVAVDSAGTLYVTYATNFSLRPSYGCLNGTCLNNVWTTDVLLGTSSNNGSSFSYSTVAAAVPAELYRWGPFHDPSPQLAIAPSSGQLFVTFSALAVEPLCTVSPCLPTLSEVVDVTNSSTGGTTWSPLHTPAANLLGFPAPYNTLYNPSIGVGTDGVLQLEMTFVNNSACVPTPFGTTCSVQTEMYTTSADNGSTFVAPYLISANATYGPYAPDGEYVTMLVAGTTPMLAWTIDVCPTWATYIYGCYYPSGNAAETQIEFSTPFIGTGLTLTFTETGLPTGSSWWIDLMGNVRSGSTASLVVSGVPSGMLVNWTAATAFSIGYGRQYRAAPPATPSPWTFTASTTITYAFAAEVLFNFQTVPSLPVPQYTSTYCFGGTTFSWNYAACPLVNYNITPTPTQIWVTPGTVEQLNVQPVGLYCAATATCYYTDYLNLTFLAFSGTGAGSVNTTANLTSVTVNGPVNETASFQTNGWCHYTYPSGGGPSLICATLNSTLLFEESGLPSGVAWNVTTTSSGGFSQTNTSTSSLLPVVGPGTLGICSYIVWTVPDPSTGQVWVPSSTPASPVVQPLDPVVQVTYTLQRVSNVQSPAVIQAVGLPNGTFWSYSVDGTGFGLNGTTGPIGSLTLASHTIGADPLYAENGTGYNPTGVNVLPYSMNSTWTNSTSVPATVTIHGPSLIQVTFATSHLVTVAIAGNGSVSPGSTWVTAGSSLRLSATPTPGNSFVGWNGSGPGSVRSSSPNIGVTPSGPITEVATFAPNPASRWVVNVSATGIPANVPYTVDLGNRSFTGAGAFPITGVASGEYTIGTPSVQLNGTSLVQYVAQSNSTSFPPGTGGAVNITTNGTLLVNFVAFYVVSASATSGGSIAVTQNSGLPPIPISSQESWYANASSVTFSATALPGYTLAAINGSGPGSVNSTQPTASTTVIGPFTETAVFVAAPIPPPLTYSVSVNATGLAPGTLWSVSVGTLGVTGTGSTLVLNGLNGSVVVQAAIASGGAGIRFLPAQNGTFPLVVSRNQSLDVAFTQQYLLTVSASSGGEVTPATQWVASGATVGITATPNSGYELVSWNGTGASGAYSGTSASASVTVNGPIAETAGFAPIPASSSSPSSTDGLPLSIGLLVALLAVGAVVGYLVGRRGRQPPAPRPEPSEEAAPAETTYGSAPDPTSDSEAPMEAPSEETPPTE